MNISRPLLALLVIFSGPALATNVIMHTPLGDVEIELFDEQAPKTVANFLNYVNDGDYENAFVHRSVADFVIQGGGFTFADETVTPVPTDAPVENEPGISNTRGTIAMAKLSGDEDSATSQWFINVVNNSFLDDSNGGFTVFGQVVKGMDVVDEINALETWQFQSPFGELPLIDYPGTGQPGVDELVFTSISVVSEFPINAGLNDAWYNKSTDGQGLFIIVYPDIRLVFLAWFTYEAGGSNGGIAAPNAVLGDNEHRWLTASGFYEEGSDRALLDISVTRGGKFDAGDPVERTTDGAIELIFEHCDKALVKYNIPSIDRTGEVEVERVAKDNLALCEAFLE